MSDCIIGVELIDPPPINITVTPEESVNDTVVIIPGGPKGEKGDTGEPGPQGPAGLRGLKGDKGDTGGVAPLSTLASDFKMDGVAAPGSSGRSADAQHIHPSDTSKADVTHTHPLSPDPNKADKTTTPTAWTNLPLNTTYVATESGAQTPQYKKDQFGNVCLRGSLWMAAPVGSGIVLATLPTGFRPPNNLFYSVETSNSGVVALEEIKILASDGTIRSTSGINGDQRLNSLNLSFSIEP